MAGDSADRRQRPSARRQGRTGAIPGGWIVDTNVIVSGVIGSGGPPSRILDAMLGGDFPYFLSRELLAEYSAVLRRLVRVHGRTDDEIDCLLAGLAANSVWHEPDAGDAAPAALDAGDNHLWALLAARPRGQLVTGDRLLIENPPDGASVVSPRYFPETFLSRRLP